MDCLTPSTLRLDKKCGASAIAKNKKCRKGAGAVAKQRTPRAGRTEKLQKRIGMGLSVAGTVTGITGAVTNNVEAMGVGYALAGVGTNIHGRGMRREAQRKGSKKLAEKARVQMFSGGAQVLIGTAGIAAGVERRRQIRKTAERASQYEYERQKRGYYRPPGAGEAPPPRNSYKGDPFKDLGVDPKASDADIKKAYARAARANHPDLGGDEEKMKKVNAAYEAIKRRRGRKDDFTLDSLTAEGVSTLRNDKKCGESSIAKNKQCRKGAGSVNLKRAALVGIGVGAAIGGAAVVKGKVQKRQAEAQRVMQAIKNTKATGNAHYEAARRTVANHPTALDPKNQEFHERHQKNIMRQGKEARSAYRATARTGIEELKKRVPLSKARTRKKLNELMGRQTNYKVKRPKKSATNTSKPRSTHDLPKLAPGSGKAL
jgi:curved DNA-binding protein CbpA